MSDKLIGKTLDGRYVLEMELGSGATGAVYRATQTAVDRVVAVKTLHAFLQTREDFKARFEIEAKAIARLNHPNCITLYDFGYDTEFDVFYMAVEYIDGESLADMMGNDELQYEDIMSISYQVAEALDHAHREGILHRDLKPENIMIQRSPNSGRAMVKVLDFGLARLYETELQGGEETPTGRYKQITQAGQVYGTPAYMSPEQCRAREELTPATDLYALGTMMFELLEGHLPFFSQSTAELIMMQMTEEPPRMERIDVPTSVRDVIFDMMQKDPEARPQSAKDVLLALMTHVRLDASQEFRVVPSESGSFRIQDGDLDKVSFGLSEPTDMFEEVDLSADEMRAANQSSLKLIVGSVILLALLGFGVVMLARSDGGGDAEAQTTDTVAVDATEPSVADSATEESEEFAEGDAEVEVAKKPTQKRPNKKRRRVRPSQTASGSAPEKAKDSDAPKTLKLTY